MTVKIITVGHKISRDYSPLIDEYAKRLPRTVQLIWQYTKHAPGDPKSSVSQESEQILKALDETSLVVLLDETGKQLSSPQLSQKIFDPNRDVTFIIGGAYGVSESIMDRADFVWSLSKLVFPHELVRLLLAEQIYRAYTISINHPYHHS